MLEKLKEILDVDFWNWAIKILPYSLAALTISIAVQMKNTTVKLSTVILTFLIGVGTSYITGGLIMKKFSPEVAPVIIGIVTITGEKIAYWLLYKFKFDVIGDSFIEWLKSKKP